MSKYHYENLIGSKVVKNYAEFEFMLAVGAEMGRRGHVLDISNCFVDGKNLIGSRQKDYLSYLRTIGSIYNGVEPEKVFSRDSEEVRFMSTPDLWFNVDLLDKVSENLVDDDGDFWTWSYECTTEKWEPYRLELVGYNTRDQMLMHLAARVFVDTVFNYREKRPLKIKMDGFAIKTSYVYIGLLTASRTNKTLRRFIQWDADWSQVGVDLEYEILYNLVYRSGNFKLWGAYDKLEELKRLGLGVGAVGVKYKRSRISDGVPQGKIDSASLIVIREIHEGDGEVGRDHPWVLYNSYSLAKTKEEIMIDYLDIPEDKRHLYMDMLDFKVNGLKSKDNLTNLGVGYLFYDEDSIIEKIDSLDSVTKTVTINGVSDQVSMSEVDAIYWLLKEYKVVFDDELFREMYNGGKELLWDLHGSQPNVREFLGLDQ